MQQINDHLRYCTGIAGKSIFNRVIYRMLSPTKPLFTLGNLCRTLFSYSSTLLITFKERRKTLIQLFKERGIIVKLRQYAVNDGFYMSVQARALTAHSTSPTHRRLRQGV